MKPNSCPIKSSVQCFVFVLIISFGFVLGACTAYSSPRPFVVVGYDTAFYVAEDGTVWAWGDRILREPRGPAVIFRGPVVAIAAGVGAFYLLLENGDLYSGGYPDHLLGRKDTKDVILGLVMHDVASVAASADRSFAVKKDGSLWAWGENDEGALGDGTDKKRFLPVCIMQGVAQVSVDHSENYHTLALMRDGSIRGWGANFHAQLGGGVTVPQKRPVRIRPTAAMEGLTITQVFARSDNSMAVTDDGTLWAWGVDR